MPLLITKFTATSPSLAHPSVEVKVPRDYKIVGGGARVDYGGARGTF
jgi:hypothetical protein